MAIVCKSQSEIDKMRRSGRIVRQILDELKSLVAPGMTTMDLEKAAENKIQEFGAKPAFKGYYDYPCVLCTSVNEEIVHGILSPERQKLLEVTEASLYKAIEQVKIGNTVSDIGAAVQEYVEANGFSVVRE